MKNSNCNFCDIVAGKIPCYKIYEDKSTLAFLDIAKDFEGHILVIPKNHYENVMDAKPNSLNHVMQAVKKISNHLQHCGFDGVNILNASGECAEQSVFHLHFHIIPRKKGDNLSTWPSRKPDASMNLEEIQKQLKFPKIS